VTYGRGEGVKLRSASEKEELRGTGGGAGGAAGTASNVPGYAAGGANGNTNYTHEKVDESVGVDQTVRNTDVAGGDPKHLFVAVAFSAPKDAKGAGAAGTGAAPEPTAAQQAAAEAVQAYLGISEKDVTDGKHRFQVSISDTPFSETEKDFLEVAGQSGPMGGGPIATATSYLKPAAALLGVLVLIFLVRRSLARRQALLGASEARWMPALAAPPIPIDEIALPTAPSAEQLEAAQKKMLQAKVEDVARERPGDVAAQLRGWLAEDR
jgi:flagellar biosynthesis/type III secretory pathway M-ring protein FliF/YscJ